MAWLVAAGKVAHVIGQLAHFHDLAADIGIETGLKGRNAPAIGLVTRRLTRRVGIGQVFRDHPHPGGLGVQPGGGNAQRRIEIHNRLLSYDRPSAVRSTLIDFWYRPVAAWQSIILVVTFIISSSSDTPLPSGVISKLAICWAPKALPPCPPTEKCIGCVAVVVTAVDEKAPLTSAKSNCLRSRPRKPGVSALATFSASSP